MKLERIDRKQEGEMEKKQEEKGNLEKKQVRIKSLDPIWVFPY